MGGLVSSIFGGGGGGGGGSAPSSPTSQTVTQTSIPEYARPYVENMLGQSAALTNINANPYQTYGGQRIQAFTPMQQQAFQNYANQGVAGQLGLGSNLAGAAGLGSINAGADYARMATDPRSISAYMSPYMQNVVDTQKNEAIRDYTKGLGALNARAVSAGAFGGNRAALERSEAGRNLGTQLANIQATGTQNAFNAAQQAQQYGAGLGLQGYGQGLQAASTLGQLGQTQYGQEMGISDALSKAGAVQQAQGQQGLDLAYQNWMQQKNYPYQQLAFMSDMLRGLPLSQSAQQQYTAGPSTLSQLGGLGTTALGIYGMSGGFKKDGGIIKGYKEGGKIGYLSGGAIQSMSTDELKRLLESPNLNPLEIEKIQNLIMVRERMENNPEAEQIMQRSGIGSIGTGDMVPSETVMAKEGGIMHFAKGGDNKEERDDYRRWLEDQVKESIMAQKDNKAFEKSDAQIAETTAGIKNRESVAPWAAVADFGAQWLAGTDPRGLVNMGQAAKSGLGTYAKSLSDIAGEKKVLLQQQVEAEKAKLARQTGLTGQMQTSLGQLYSKDAALEAARVARETNDVSKRRLDLDRAQAKYNSLFTSALAKLNDSAKIGRINYKKYKADPSLIEKDARAIALNQLSPDLKDLLNFEEANVPGVDNPAPAAPAAPAAKKGPVTVAAPNGKSYTFPTQEAADQFKKQIGL